LCKEDLCYKERRRAVLNFGKICRKKCIYLAAFLSAFAVLCTGCKSSGSAAENLILHLAFDEKGGTTAADSAGKAQDARVHYIYNNAAYMENKEPG